MVTKVVQESDGSGLLGYATLAQSSDTTSNGIVVAYSVWGPPGTCASSSRNAEGATATHEVGHYLGLLHTFADGGAGNLYHSSCGAASAPHCHQTGDLLCDTPPEAAAIFDCVSRGTCSARDPVENFMDYSDDFCLTTFTDEQARRCVNERSSNAWLPYLAPMRDSTSNTRPQHRTQS